MNFHKTIGYLAALLLIVGLGAPDSFAQDVQSLSITVSPKTLRDSTTANGGQVTVTARLTVVLKENVPDDDPNVDDETRDVDVVLAVSPDGTTAPLDDDNVSYTVSGVGTETVMVPEGKNRITHSAELVFTLSHDDDTDDEEATVTATIAAAEVTDDGSGTDAEAIEKTADVTVTDHSASLVRNAASARGYQVFLTAPAGGATAKAANKAVKVQVRRKRGFGSEYGAFASIKIALRNRDAKDEEDVPDEDLYSLTISDPIQLGTLVLSRVRSDELTGTAAGNTTVDPSTTLNANNTKAIYTRGSDYDVLEFQFHPTGGGSYNKLYALATFVTTTTDDTDPTISSLDTETSIYPPDPESFPGQVVGNGVSGKIDAGKPDDAIITSITVEIDGEEVGDPEGSDTQQNLLDAKTTAGDGQTIKISASIADFGESKLGFEIIGRDAKGIDVDGTMTYITAGAEAEPATPAARLAPQVLRGHTFSQMGAIDVLREVSQGRPVVVEVEVTAGKFERKANLAKHPDDEDPRYVAKDGWYEDDDVVVQVRAFVMDRAGNKQVQAALSHPFILDSRLPKVAITYPKPSATTSDIDSTRFTAATTQDYGFLDGGGGSVVLKPLNFTVDEVAPTVYIVIDEDTLIVREEDTTIDGSTGGELDGGYDLSDADAYLLKNPDVDDEGEAQNDRPEVDSEQGGADVKLQIVAMDRSGNVGKGTPDGGDATFDAKAPEVTVIFPTNDALEAALGNKIGGIDRTQDPIFQVNEATDSIVVRYVSSERTLDVVFADGSSKMDENISVQFLDDAALVEGEAYDLQVYSRDLAGQIGISDADPDADGTQAEQDLIFEEGLMNPQASDFKIVSEVRDSSVDPDADDVTDADVEKSFAKEDSVVAGQSVRLEITANDAMLDDRAAIAYRKDVTLSATNSYGNQVSSVSFWGAGVTDNEDGSAALAGTSWNVGVFGGVFLRATKAGDYTIAVKELDDADVAVVTGEADIHVDAANFAGFNIAILENNEPVDDIRGAFQLKVESADEFGNVSVKAYKGEAIGDSLDLLDSRMPEETTLSYPDGIDATFSSWPVVTQLPPPIFPLPVPEGGRTFGIPEPPAGETLWIHVAVVNGNLNSDDTQSKDVSSSETFEIKSALTPALTLWPEGVEVDGKVAIPADPGEVTVTVRAQGYTSGDMITFTVDGADAGTTEADADGYATVDVTRSEDATVTVSATDGRYSVERTIVFESAPDEPTRVPYTNADGEAVYLVYEAGGSPGADLTVGANDLLALIAAFGEYNVQADLDSDGDVDIDDFLKLIGSWGRTAVDDGPATKPIVLLPGVNENAEFSLSLGSERVVAGELMAIDVSLANVAALMGYGFALNYEADKFEFISVAPADEDLLTSTGGETLFHHVVADGQISVATGMYNGTAISGGGDIVRFVFRVLREFEDNARFEIADGLVFDPSQLQNPAVVAGVLELQSTPREFALRQNFPNPFNPDTTIKYDLAESADVTLQIYNVLGQVVRTLVGSEAQNAGRYQIRWNGMDDRGVPVSSGVYFYQISAGKFQDVRKLMLLK